MRKVTNRDVSMKCMWIMTEAMGSILITKDPQVAAFRIKKPEEDSLMKGL